jgi:hypothetical protein
VRTTDLVSPDLTYRQVEHWISQGYIPGIETHGSGVPTDVTDEQADWIVTMGRLVKAGFRPARAAEIIATSVHGRGVGRWRATNLTNDPQHPTLLTFTYGRNPQ